MVESRCHSRYDRPASAALVVKSFKQQRLFLGYVMVRDRSQALRFRITSNAALHHGEPIR